VLRAWVFSFFLVGVVGLEKNGEPGDLWPIEGNEAGVSRCRAQGGDREWLTLPIALFIIGNRGKLPARRILG